MFRYYRLLKRGECKEEKTSANTKKWEEKNDWALTFLMNNIDAEVFNTIPDMDLVGDIWKYVEHRFATLTTSTLPQIEEQVFALQWEAGASIKDHLTYFASKR